MNQVPVIIDTDAGIDDLVALALAARSPTFDIIAVTTIYGCTRLGDATRNAREVLKRAGRPDVLVHPGADTPLSRELATAPQMHGSNGAGYAPVPPAKPADSKPNGNVLHDVLSAIDKPVILVTLGPLTNLAQLLLRDVTLAEAQIVRHIGMFGSIYEPSEVQRWADFNTWSDPEAADQVLRAGLDTLMVGLDVTRQIVLRPDEVESLTRLADPLVRWLGKALRYYVESHRKRRGLNGCVVNDVLPIGELLTPGMLTCEQRRIEVGLGADADRGRTREDPRGCPTRVATSVDTLVMRRLLGRVFGDEWLALADVGGNA